MIRSLGLVFVFALALAAGGISGASALTIDGFRTPVALPNGAPGGPAPQATEARQTPADAVGDRTARIDATDAFGDSMEVRDGLWIMNGFRGAVYSVGYGEAQALDLALPGTAFEIGIIDGTDGGEAAFTIALTSGAGTAAEASGQAGFTFGMAGGTFQIAFKAFPGIDFSDIDDIRLEVDSRGLFGADMQIAPVRAVPLPGGALLLLGALGGLAWVRGRRGSRSQASPRLPAPG